NLVSGTSRARDAIENVGDALASMDASQAQKSARQMVEEFRLTEDRMWALIQGSDQYRDALTRIIDSQGRTANRQELLAAAIGKGVYAMTDAANEAAVWEGSLERVAEDAAGAEDALNQLRDAILAITGQSADFSQAQEALSGAFNSARDAALGFQGSLFDTSDEAISFRSNLRDLDTSAREAALALADSGASADEVRAKYREGRDALIDLISGFFTSREEAARWADEVFGSAEEVEGKLGETADAMNSVPDEVHTDVTQEGAENVQNEAKKTRERLAEIQDERRTR